MAQTLSAPLIKRASGWRSLAVKYWGVASKYYPPHRGAAVFLLAGTCAAIRHLGAAKPAPKATTMTNCNSSLIAGVLFKGFRLQFKL
jgi:hypothetical protein